MHLNDGSTKLLTMCCLLVFTRVAQSLSLSLSLPHTNSNHHFVWLSIYFLARCVRSMMRLSTKFSLPFYFNLQVFFSFFYSLAACLHARWMCVCVYVRSLPILNLWRMRMFLFSFYLLQTFSFFVFFFFLFIEVVLLISFIFCCCCCFFSLPFSLIQCETLLCVCSTSAFAQRAFFSLPLFIAFSISCCCCVPVALHVSLVFGIFLFSFHIFNFRFFLSLSVFLLFFFWSCR